MRAPEGRFVEAAYELFRQDEVFRALDLDPARTPRGILAPSDATAYGFLRAAAEFGLSPGADFGLIGFDDGPNSRTLGLTSLRPPFEALGQEAVGVIRRLMQGETMNLQVRLHSHLLPRASTSMHIPRPRNMGRP
jgi:DNA-binding LacI/PurR family transcriptional regulator